MGEVSEGLLAVMVVVAAVRTLSTIEVGADDSDFLEGEKDVATE